MNFSNRLVNFRKLRGLNQETLAERVGVSRQAVSKWETGEAQPDFAKLLALADALEVSLDELCGRTAGDAAQFPPVPSAEQPSARKGGARIAILVLSALVILLLAYVAAFFLFGRADTVQEEHASVIFSGPITVSGMEFSRQGKVVHYSFAMSVVDEACSYMVTFTDHDGYVESSVPEFTNGIFHGTVNLNEFYTYRVNVTVTQGEQHRVVPVLKNLLFSQNGYSYNAIE